MAKNQSISNPPVSLGESVTVPISGYGHEGEGVGRYRDFTVFVAGALQDEVVRVKISEVKKNFARGVLEEVVQPSPQRVAAPCPVYRECGGCQLQHLNYAAQLELKRQRVVDALERIGGLSGVKVHPVLGMEEPWYYRNKVQYPVGMAGDGTVAMGFYQQGTHRIVPMQECRLQPSDMNRMAAAILSEVTQCGIPAYDERTGSGLLRHVLVRKGFGSGELMVVLVTSQATLPAGPAVAARLTAAFPELKSIVQNINPARGNVILGPQTRVLWGRENIIDRLDGLAFKISPRSFFQVNPSQTKVLYGQAVAYAGLTGAETVVDAYCGVGSLTLFLARQAQQVYGIEVVPEAIRDARENAALNHLTNAEFRVGATEKVLPELVAAGLHFEVGVVDPPRSGCERSVLESLATNRVGRIVYVSCNPSTLARDLKVLAELGYQTAEVQPVDMFPQTYHIECVVRLNRKHIQDITEREK